MTRSGTCEWYWFVVFFLRIFIQRNRVLSCVLLIVTCIGVQTYSVDVIGVHVRHVRLYDTLSAYIRKTSCLRDRYQ